MKILAVGGGSGGHVTPVVAVLRELKSRYKHNDLHVRFWCDRSFAPKAQGIVAHFDPQLKVETIASGKFRRYHNLPVWRQLLRPVSIVLPNIRDLFFIAFGIMQSVTKMIFWRPDVVFTKGGFVCLPVGIAAKILRVPLVIHESDVHSGLTNRILARWATAIATGAPLEYYSFSKKISTYVGIPISKEFTRISSAEQKQYKAELGFNPATPLVVVTGGGLGATRLNDAVAATLPDILLHMSVLLISGTNQYDELRALTPQDDTRFQLKAFVSNDMHKVLGAADIVVARAGATTLVELAALAKPTILVPNGYLTGGHQLKNAAAYAEQGAAIIVDDTLIDKDPQQLRDALLLLVNDPVAMKNMAHAMYAFAKPNAAKDMADIIVGAVKK